MKNSFILLLLLLFSTALFAQQRDSLNVEQQPFTKYKTQHKNEISISAGINKVYANAKLFSENPQFNWCFDVFYKRKINKIIFLQTDLSCYRFRYNKTLFQTDYSSYTPFSFYEKADSKFLLSSLSIGPGIKIGESKIIELAIYPQISFNYIFQKINEGKEYEWYKFSKHSHYIGINLPVSINIKLNTKTKLVISGLKNLTIYPKYISFLDSYGTTTGVGWNELSLDTYSINIGVSRLF